MVRIWSLCLLLLAACAAPSTTTPTAQPPPTASWLRFELGRVQVRMREPVGWDIHQTEYHMVLEEHGQKPEGGALLDGLLVTLWAPPLQDFGLEIVQHQNSALVVLEHVVSARDYVGSAAISQPQALVWSDHQAAYYMLNDGCGHMTLVLALALPGDEHLLAINISAPAGSGARMRALLPELFNGLVINGRPLANTALHNLPDPLPFPPNGDCPENTPEAAPPD